MTAASFTQIIISFLLVTIVGGIFANRLQHRNWIRQQQISSQEKLIAELKSIFIELDGLMSRRIYRTRRLLYGLRRYEEKKLKSTLKRYDEVINDWNEKRNSFQIRLVRVVSTSLAQEFEHDLSRRFIRIGLQLERVARRALTEQRSVAGDLLTELELELDSLSRSIYEYLRSIYIRLQQEQTELYTIDKSSKIPKTEDNLASVSTWFLFKALFVPAPVAREET